MSNDGPTFRIPGFGTGSIYGPGGGETSFTGLDSNTGFFPSQLLNQDRLQQVSTTNYVLFHKDGSKDVYDLSLGQTIYRTKSVDSAGNFITYNYDNFGRLRTVVDALGQTTVIDYFVDTYNPDFPSFMIAKVTDPFGRYATFAYKDNGQLGSITDELGITSSFTYGNPLTYNIDFVNSLTTPYGTTTFSGNDVISGGRPSDRWLMATDPTGAKERIEWVFDCSAVAGSDPQTTVPAGFSNAYLNYRNTFYWDKLAMAKAPNDYSKAKITHWLHQDDTNASTVVESTKEPFENRVWRGYAGQPNPIYVGTSNKPTRVARILDDGTEQDYQYQYNASGNVTQAIDSLGRETDYVYDTNNIDLLQILQKDGTGYDVLGSFTYNAQHEPLTVTDASEQITIYTYNSAGQVRTVTNAKGQTTTFWYSLTGIWTGQPALDPNATGYLVQMDGPATGATARFNYDGFGRIQSATDSEGYTVTTNYDVFDRPTSITYPDGTSTQILYNRLDAEWIRDRLGRWTRQMHDALRHVALVQDSLGRKTSYDWCSCGSLSAIIDPAGNATTWLRDVQGRVSKKIFPDGTLLSYNYENSTSRLKSATDAMGQVTNYAYNLDNSIQQLSYADSSGNQLASTDPVVYTYDPVFPRLLTMTDGVGTTAFTYNQLTNVATPGTGTVTPTTGAGRIGSWVDTLTNSTISYTYDELGRMLGSSINETANASSVVYDTLGRIQSATNPLGTFGYQYVNQTGRLQQIAYPNGQVTNFSYYPNSAATPGNDDQRLAQIQNLAPGGANLSTFGYGYNAAGMITNWSKQVGAAAALTSSFAYDAADQLVGASVPNGTSGTNFSYAYDLAGNRTREQIDPGVTSSTYNNLNQLTGQNPGGPMQFSGTVNKWATVTVGGQSVTTDAGGNWTATANVSPGANAIPLVARDVNGNTTTKTISITVSGGAARTLTYDLNGNMINDGAGKVYGYDAANRMVSITQGGNVTGFVYNGFGQRVQETLNGTVIKQWVWAGGAQPAEERDGANSVTKRFYAQGEQVGGTSYFFTTDHLGSIREMTDASGAVRARYEYDPFGRTTKVSGDLESDFGYAGYMRGDSDDEYWTRFRVYRADLARWLSRDPIAEQGGLNLYGYCLNDPINHVDPFGLSSVASPDPFDPCKDPCGDLLDSIKDLARHIRGRYNDMLFDRGGLYGNRFSGPMSWRGHQQQFQSQQRRLRDAIQKYNDRGCGQKIPVPAFVNIEAVRETPDRPLRNEINAFDRWITQTTISDQTLDRLETGVLITTGTAATIATAGLAGPYVTAALGTGGALATAGSR
jgi:RHS repeat-associated protein